MGTRPDPDSVSEGRPLKGVSAEEPAWQAARSLRDAYYNSGVWPADAVEALAHQVFSSDDSQARAAIAPLFGGVIEPLADSYEPEARQALEQLLAAFIERARRRPDAASEVLDQKLRRLDLADEEALLQRLQNIRRLAPRPVNPSCRTLLLLSRVTLGADVLLNGMAAQRFLKVQPEARILLLANPKNLQLFSGNAQIVGQPFEFGRGATFLERLLRWVELVGLVRKLVEAHPDLAVVNLDSRLLQSGLLPLLDADQEPRSYFFWDPTDRISAAKKTTSLGQRLQGWLGETFPAPEAVDPAPLWLNTADREYARNLLEHRHPATPRRVAINLGVGGNLRKRIAAQGDCEPTPSLFEKHVLLGLLMRGYSVLLDKGFGEFEERQADGLLKAATDEGYRTLSLRESQEPDSLAALAAAQVISFHGSVARFAALVDRCALYVGYDSQGQHVAAASGCDVVTVFAGYDQPAFPDHWQPNGTGRIEVIRAGPGPFTAAEQRSLARDVLTRCA
jgi:hypothetical protein